MVGNPFVTFRDTDRTGKLQYYILQRDYPHYLGIISEQPIADAIFQFPVAKHRLWVVFVGVLRGSYIPAYKDALQEIEHVFVHMANWFYENRIAGNPKKYRKWAVL